MQGPTAVGKTELALNIAQKFDLDIISADSRQIYKKLNIGTAKPSIKILKEFKHHFINIIDPKEKYDAGRFRDEATKIIDKLHLENRFAIVVGGTGFYIKSLFKNLFEINKITKDTKNKVQHILSEKGYQYIFDILKEKDPKSCDRVHYNDKHRILRAFEVLFQTNIPISEHWQNQTDNDSYRNFDILLTRDRNELYQRINTRVDKMMNDGLIQEIDFLLKNGYSFEDAGFNTVGYKEFADYFQKKNNLEFCVDKVKQHSRNYAKRQLTWYRKMKFNIAIPSEKNMLLNVESKIENFLNRED
ncbi:MAG: tRNA (adenosine(37)-N6)-dimethylallyltransferase MiaA [Candidatus Cloacimonadota bacterium]|nr:tRNA (adenosine(37)-N6)-dimethylallyltransferase MiaA [Candidatus Cloacimonadota bacterium]